MGLSLFKSCTTQYAFKVPAPNPDPHRWKLLQVWKHMHGYVLKVHYLDAINFEGIKIMVYRGTFPGKKHLRSLDPHFQPSKNAPIARFRPDSEGIAWANKLASKL